MDKVEFEPWEPEETVGKLWHAFASRLGAPPEYLGAAVRLSELDGRLAVFFRAIGGAPATELKAVRDEVSHHRLGWRRKLGTERERTPQTSFDGEALRLPERLAVFPAREANAALYLWLAAAAAHWPDMPAQSDPLRRDLTLLWAADRAMDRIRADFPGLVALYGELATGHVQQRPPSRLPAAEMAMESLIRLRLGDDTALTGLAAEWQESLAAGTIPEPDAPRGYHPFQPVPLWIDMRELSRSAATEAEASEGGDAEDAATESSFKAKRRQADQAERQDSLILHKFEAILSWAEFLNLNRRVDDDDQDDAKKAADDQDEIGLGQISKAPATRLKLHLDLAPEDVDREALSAEITYPEWDCRSGCYLPQHARVLDAWGVPAGEDALPTHDPAAHRRIDAVRRRFEALRPGRFVMPAQPDGDELDLEAAVRAQSEHRACGESNDRIWRLARPMARDLAVSILLDVSRSTESAVSGRSVIDIEREALTALAWGLEACGDDFAINAFSSLKRHRVYFTRCKAFGEPMSQLAEARIAALSPGFYTRMGTAIRHASAGLAEQTRKRRLLLLLTDGKPNDLDHYEGRHGVEDTAMAVREARRGGHAVHAVTVDARAKAHFARMFGQGGFSIVPHPDRLIQALPEIYRHLVGA